MEDINNCSSSSQLSVLSQREKSLHLNLFKNQKLLKLFDPQPKNERKSQVTYGRMTPRKKFALRLPKKEVIQILLRGASNQLERFQERSSLSVIIANECSTEFEHRYPKRNLRRLSYTESYSSDDELHICEEYEGGSEDPSWKDSAISWVLETKVFQSVSKRTAQKIPSFLVIRQSTIPKVGPGVWTEVFLPEGILFGPYKGKITKNCNETQRTGYSWMLRKSNKTQNCLEGYSKEKSNWLRYVNCGDREDKQNLLAFQYRNKIYYRTYKPVLPFQELLVWYSDKYAVELGIDALKNAEALIKEEIDGYKCDVCHALFSSQVVMLRHKKTHSHVIQNQRYKCHECEYSTTFKCRLRDHFCVHATTGKVHKCRRCDKVFLRSNNLRSHERVHANEKPFSCDVCGRAFKWNQALRVHCRIHTGERPFRCSTCGKDFVQLSNLKTHMRMHTAQRPYKCPYCYYRSSQSQHLHQHVIVRHTKQFPLTCPECGKGFIRPSRYRDHLEKKHSGKQKVRKRRVAKVVHDGVNDSGNNSEIKEKTKKGLQKQLKLYKCTLCNYRYIRADLLKKHVTLKHSGDYPHTCMYCKRGFFTLMNLKEHLLKNHPSFQEIDQSNELSISSKEKESNTSKERDLKTEEEKHSKMKKEKELSENSYDKNKNYSETKLNTIEKDNQNIGSNTVNLQLELKPYKCPHCEYICNQAQQLSRHINSKHAKHYPHACFQCGKGFLRPARLKKHIEKFHKNVEGYEKYNGSKHKIMKTKLRKVKTSSELEQVDRKPYTCPDCDFACLRSNLFSQHVIEQHTHDYPYVCPQCGEGFLRPIRLREHFAKMHAGVAHREGKTSSNQTKVTETNKTVEFAIKETDKAQTRPEKLPCFKCPHCDYSCFLAQQLSQHVIATHTTDRLYACCQCEKYFNSPINLRKHFKKRHVAQQKVDKVSKEKTGKEKGEVLKKPALKGGKSLARKEKKPHKCPHCEYKCSQKQHLAQHVIVKHTGEYPLSCSQCGKGFILAFRLKQHLEKRHPVKKVKDFLEKPIKLKQ